MKLMDAIKGELTHGTAVIGGKRRSVWYNLPLPESFRNDCDAQRMFGMLDDLGELALVATYLADVSLSFWSAELVDRDAAKVLRDEFDKRIKCREEELKRQAVALL